MSYAIIIQEPILKPVRFHFKVELDLENENRASKLATWLRENAESCYAATGIKDWMTSLANIIENK